MFLSKPQPLSGGIFWISPIFWGFLPICNHLHLDDGQKQNPRSVNHEDWRHLVDCNGQSDPAVDDFRPIRYCEDKIPKSRKFNQLRGRLVIFIPLCTGVWGYIPTGGWPGDFWTINSDATKTGANHPVSEAAYGNGIEKGQHLKNLKQWTGSGRGLKKFITICQVGDCIRLENARFWGCGPTAHKQGFQVQYVAPGFEKLGFFIFSQLDSRLWSATPKIFNSLITT